MQNAGYGLHGCETTGTSILVGPTAFTFMVYDDGGNRHLKNIVPTYDTAQHHSPKTIILMLI
jgi:hypothetical protein